MVDAGAALDGEASFDVCGAEMPITEVYVFLRFQDHQVTKTQEENCDDGEARKCVNPAR